MIHNHEASLLSPPDGGRGTDTCGVVMPNDAAMPGDTGWSPKANGMVGSCSTTGRGRSGRRARWWPSHAAAVQRAAVLTLAAGPSARCGSVRLVPRSPGCTPAGRARAPARSGRCRHPGRRCSRRRRRRGRSTSSCWMPSTRGGHLADRDRGWRAARRGCPGCPGSASRAPWRPPTPAVEDEPQVAVGGLEGLGQVGEVARERLDVARGVALGVQHDRAVVDQLDGLGQRLGGRPVSASPLSMSRCRSSPPSPNALPELVDHGAQVLLVDRVDGAVEVEQERVDPQRVGGVLARDGVAVCEVRAPSRAGWKSRYCSPTAERFSTTTLVSARDLGAALDPRVDDDAVPRQPRPVDPADRDAAVGDLGPDEDAAGLRRSRRRRGSARRPPGRRGRRSLADSTETLTSVMSRNSDELDLARRGGS